MALNYTTKAFIHVSNELKKNQFIQIRIQNKDLVKIINKIIYNNVDEFIEKPITLHK